jgi:hypothetical protein
MGQSYLIDVKKSIKNIIFDNLSKYKFISWDGSTMDKFIMGQSVSKNSSYARKN